MCVLCGVGVSVSASYDITPVLPHGAAPAVHGIIYFLMSWLLTARSSHWQALNLLRYKFGL